MIFLGNRQKKNKIISLSLSDVLSILINNEQKQDRTEELKDFLTRKRKMTEYEEKNMREHMILPEFAEKNMTEQQLLTIHLSAPKRRNIQKYQFLITEVDKQLNYLLKNYSCKFQEGRNSFQDFKRQIDQCYTILQKQRNKLQMIGRKGKLGRMQNIVRLTRKKDNLKKILDVIRIWGDTNLCSLLLLQTSKLGQNSLKQILCQFKSAAKILQRDMKFYEGLHNIIEILQQKQKKLCTQIMTNIENSIIEYIDIPNYGKKYHQYLQLLEYEQKQTNILLGNSLLQLAQRNSNQIYCKIMRKHTLDSLEGLNEQIYEQFFKQLMDCYILYFSNWHKITTFHINQNNQSQSQGFVKNRTTIYQIFANNLSYIIQHNIKFSTLSIGAKINLSEQIYQFLQNATLWMGTCKNNLSSCIADKFYVEGQIFCKSINAELKINFIEQFSIDGIQSCQNINSKDDLNIIRELYENKTQTLAKVKKLLTYNNNQSSQQQRTKEQNNKHLNLKQSYSKIQQSINLNFSNIFLRSIFQYLYREQYLAGKSQLKNIINHFQLILFLQYRILLGDLMKKWLYEDILMDSKIKLNQIRNNTDESIWNIIKQLRESQIRKQKYTKIYNLLSVLTRQYEGLSLNGQINLSKINQLSNKDHILKCMYGKILKLGYDLSNIRQWLMINYDVFFYNKDQSLKKSLNKLGQQITQMTMLCLQPYFNEKRQNYISVIWPIISSLKWQIKKFNNQLANQYKQYKVKMLNLYSNNILIQCKHNQTIKQIITNSQIQIFYQTLIQMYGYIQKINDNGRQLIIVDGIQIGKSLQQPQWINKNLCCYTLWFQKYLQLIVCRSTNQLINQIQKYALKYPISAWRNVLLWVVTDCSTKQRKQYMSKLINIYKDILQQNYTKLIK